jgi:uncharacterized protein YidB (DUF937 family)
MIVEILNNIAKQFLTDVNADGKVDIADAVNSLQSLLADASNKVDFNAIIAKLQNSDLSVALSSWLGDGENSVLSADSITNIIDSEKLNQFAASLKIDIETAKNGLAKAIPNLIDQISSGGQLMDKFNAGIASLQEEVTEAAASLQEQATEVASSLQEKVADVATAPQEQASEAVATANSTACGLFAKIKQFFS